jgi:transcriptional regulator with XRE-family HTH domain
MSSDRIPHFGSAIRTLREKAGISQKELGRRISRSQNLISYWESESEGAPRISAELFAEVAYALGATPHELMELAERLSDNDDKGRAA